MFSPIRPRLEGIFGPEQVPFQMSRNLFGDQARSESDIGMEGRMQGMFKPQGELKVPEDDLDNPYARMQELYSPETYFQDEYKKLLSSIPERNKPGIWRKLGAIFAGNPEEQQHALYAPYERNLQDWDLKRKALEPGLNAERYGNVNERQVAANIMQNESTNKRIDLQEGELRRKEKADEAKNKQNDEKIKIQRQRANAYIYGKENPNKIIKEDSNGNLITIDPQSGDTEYLLDDDGDPIKSINLTPEQRHNNRMSEIKAQADAAMARTKVAGANTIAAAKVRGEQARTTKTTPPAKAVSDPDKVDTTTSTVQVKDAEGKSVGTRTTTTQKTTQAGRNTGIKMQLPPTPKYPKGRIALVPKSDVDKVKAQGGKVVP